MKKTITIIVSVVLAMGVFTAINKSDDSVESCDVMPPAKAYWAVIIKKNQTVPLIPNEWGWAQKGINETYLSSGDKIGLVFSTDEEVRWP